MQTSAEIRWFWRRELPLGLKDWFCEGSVHGFRAGGGGERIDVYLLDASQPELGIKQRGEKKGVEIKGLVEVIERDSTAGPFAGSIEIWTKWTSGPLKLPEDSVLPINKRRWLRKFDTTGPTLKEIMLGADEKPLNQPLPAKGCNVEVTELTIRGGEAWWTLGFESFGTLTTVEEDLFRVAKELVLRDPPSLNGGIKVSYPVWLIDISREAGWLQQKA